MLTLKREADNLIRWPGPYSKSANLPIDILNYAAAVVTLRLYAEEFEMRVIPAWVRTREEVAAGLSAVTCPNFLFNNFIQTGDVISWTSPGGKLNRRTATTYTRGTGIETPATNFDSLSWTDGASTEVIPKGTKIYMNQKAIGNDLFPVDFKVRPLPTLLAAAGLTAEIETDLPGTIIESAVSTTFAWEETIATEDGKVAMDQDRFDVFDVGTPAGGSTVSETRKIRLRIGDPIVMAEYPVGIHIAGDDDWGWEGTVPDIMSLNSEIRANDQIRVHVTLSGVAGLQDVQSRIAKVVER